MDSTDTIITDKDNYLIAACQTVAKAAGISFPVFTHKLLYNSLEKIAEHAQFRYRLVKLSLNWWLTDNGPLLAFKKNNNKPCALIPKPNGGYQLIDPQSGVSQTISAELAQSLADEAYFFYRTLPNKSLNLIDLLDFVKPIIKNEFWKVIFIFAVINLMLLLTPIATSNLFSYVIPNADTSVLVQWVAILFASALASLAFLVSQNILLLRLRFKLNIALDNAIWDRLIHLPLSLFQKFSAGDLAQRAIGVDIIQKTLTNVIVNHLLAGIFAFIPLILMFYYNVVLTLWTLFLIAIYISIYVFSYWLQIKYQRLSLKAEGLLSGQILQFLTGISKLRTTCSEEYAFQICKEKLADNVTAFYQSNMLTAKMNVLSGSMIVIVLLLIYAIAYAQGNKLSFGHFIGFIAAFGFFSAAIFSITQDILTVVTTFALYERIKIFFTTQPETIQVGIDPGQLTGIIKVENLNFSYHPQVPLLQDLSFAIHTGEFIAIVGSSGSGKSTLVRLLLGLILPMSGKIIYDDFDLNTLNLKILRKQIGVVLQNDALLATTIFENICGSQTLSLKEAWEIARLVGLDKEIKAMPMGMHTIIMEGGKTISGGQKQRLMLARALARQPSILILDEAMNALDNTMQNLIQRNLDELRLTRIFVTHRLNSIRLANRIYVIDQGKIVQGGDFKSLLYTPGIFADLAKHQHLKE